MPEQVDFSCCCENREADGIPISAHSNVGTFFHLYDDNIETWNAFTPLEFGVCIVCLYSTVYTATDIQYHILDWVSAISSAMCLSGVCVCVAHRECGSLFRTQACVRAQCDLRLHFESLTDSFSKPVIYLFVYCIFPIDGGFLFRSFVVRILFYMYVVWSLRLLGEKNNQKFVELSAQ